MSTTYLQLGNKNYYKGKAMYFVSLLMILKSDMNDNRTIFLTKIKLNEVQS